MIHTSWLLRSGMNTDQDIPAPSLFNTTECEISEKRSEVDRPSNDDTLPPEHPTRPCPNCGCREYWLRDNKWEQAEWLCCRCRPEPELTRESE